MENRVIILENVSKKFKIGRKEEKKTTLANFISVFSGREAKKDFWALREVSFSVNSGENLGIIGKNGSGKTTLLRVLAGVYEPSSGKVKTKGNIVCLMGLGQGLSHKLTMRENIFLMGSILGLSPKDIKIKFDEIVSFSGLEKFLDTKVYQFSSGMIIRLNFSVMIHCLRHSKPDILLLDEVFGAGGDIDFEEKAIKKMEEFVTGGATVVLASHDLDIIKKYCDRVIWLDKGEIAGIGEAQEIIFKYLSS